MAETVEVLIEDDRWQAFDLAALATRAAELAFAATGVSADFEVSVLACDDAKIATLNQQFRGQAKATNVLSWPAQNLAPEEPGQRPTPPVFTPDAPELGDIAIAYEVVMAEASAARVPPADHITHLLVHAILHLLGYDHQTDADASQMEALETKALASQGIADPY